MTVADCDADSPRLAQNLAELLGELAASASNEKRPALPTLTDTKAWQRRTMKGLTVPDSKYVGSFRGEPGLERVDVRIGSAMGVAAAEVAAQLTEFEARLREVLRVLDRDYPSADALDEDGVGAVTDVAGWAHAEWVRIHPCANGNGRTARLLANVILMRYGIAPVVRLGPRPNEGYAEAAGKSMSGDWEPTADFIRTLVVQAYRLGDPGRVH